MLNDKFGKWPKVPEWLKDFEKKCKKDSKCYRQRNCKTVKAVQFNIGGVLRIGFETQLKIKNIPIQVSALASEKMILEVTKNGADKKML